MKRITTVEDFSRCEQVLNKRSKSGVQILDPLEDPSLPMSEKHRLASLWEVVQSHRQNYARLQDLVRPLMAQGPMSVNATPERTTFPLSSGLQLACLYGDLNLVKMLVSRGENIDQVTMSPDNFGRGRCPMSVAAELGHNAILEFLINAGGDARNVHDPPLRQAVRRNDLAAVSMLVKGGADPDPTLHQLLWPSCNISVVRMLLEAGANPTGTMLLTALWRGCEAAVIETLLEFGAPFRSDLENESALEVAICRGADRHIVEVLLKAASKWLPHTHNMFPRSFRDRVFSFCLVNERFYDAFGKKLPNSVLHRIFQWLGVGEKRDGDCADLRRALCNTCDLTMLEQRMMACGFGEIVAMHEYSNSKTALLENLKTTDLLKLLWFEEPPVQAQSHYLFNAPRSHIRMSHTSDSTLDSQGRPMASDDADNVDDMDQDNSDDDDDEDNDNSNKPYMQKKMFDKRLKRPSAPSAPATVFTSSDVASLAPSFSGSYGGNNNNNRRISHPVADSKNANSPKPHHCTCCHVCHVSMKQRPRPIAACSQCNTIICKLCLQDRWKNDQWEEASANPGWVCHKCQGNCVCKSCKSKGTRAMPGGAIPVM